MIEKEIGRPHAKATRKGATARIICFALCSLNPAVRTELANLTLNSEGLLDDDLTLNGALDSTSAMSILGTYSDYKERKLA